ncbi:MAG TPA: NAD(P)/FAD-dependent oxidoreductase [Steroidobacteraceae bacterium]|nr:NAD(P)/FAD-dependent oxidoreductase [Steroidobacteraceae bacterium]
MIISRHAPAASRYDALVIGAGHNGLTCACYLARAGLKVAVFERRPIVGGAAVTEEFHPGFRNSTASYTVSLLNPQVIRDLRLAEHGLTVRERPMQNFLPLPNGDALSFGPAMDASLTEVRRHSRRDAERLPDYYAMLDRVVAYLRIMLRKTPPTNLHRVRDAWSALTFGATFRRLPLRTQREIHELFTRSAGELLEPRFESDAVKALFGFDAIVGAYQSPYTPGSAYVLLHHAFGEVNGKTGVWGHAMGGMGAITQAMAREAGRLGVHIEVDAPVKRVIVEQGRARGIELADGRTILAKLVAANTNPKLLFLELLEPEHVEPDFRARIERYRCESATLRMNVALSELPRFTARPEPGPHLSSGIIIAPSLAYMDDAWCDARSQGWSRAPIVEMLIPSTVDDSLAPPGAHVASLFCQHFRYRLPDGRTWDDAREAAADAVIDLVTQHAPNFRASILGRLVLTPLDLERRFGLVGGDIFHGALGLDQLWASRPVLGHGDYRMPIAGLYLCGSGAHPGGGVTGMPGSNAAREMLRDRAG